MSIVNVIIKSLISLTNLISDNHDYY